MSIDPDSDYISGVTLIESVKSESLLDTFFNTLNSYYFQMYYSNDMLYIRESLPYGLFNVTADDVLSGKYNASNPYIANT